MAGSLRFLKVLIGVAGPLQVGLLTPEPVATGQLCTGQVGALLTYTAQPSCVCSPSLEGQFSAACFMRSARWVTSSRG